MSDRGRANSRTPLQFIPPEAQDRPARFLQSGCLAAITVTIPPNLGTPVLSIGRRTLAASGTSIPKAAVDEDDNAGTHEDEVGTRTLDWSSALTMVWLAKWIREHVEDSRVLLITDRAELDEQIEKVFLGVGENIHRTRSAADMLDVLNRSTEWLICSLIHKFRGREDERARDEAGRDFIEALRAKIPKNFSPKGNLFVFVDEAHRTQSGKMHQAMTELLPGAMLIGFTGTPLLKFDKTSSIETFGSFIHTYKFDEAIADGVVLDLRYEARKHRPKTDIAAEGRRMVRGLDKGHDRPGRSTSGLPSSKGCRGSSASASSCAMRLGSRLVRW